MQSVEETRPFSQTSSDESILVNNLKAVTAEAYSVLASISAISSVDKLREFVGDAQRSLEEEFVNSEEGVQTCCRLLRRSTHLFKQVIMDYADMLETATSQARLYSKQLRVIEEKTVHGFSSLHGFYIDDSDIKTLKDCEDFNLKQAMIDIAVSCDNLEDLVSKANAHLRKEQVRRSSPKSKSQYDFPDHDNDLYESPKKSLASSVFEGIKSITNVCSSKKSPSPAKSIHPASPAKSIHPSPPVRHFSIPIEAEVQTEQDDSLQQENDSLHDEIGKLQKEIYYLKKEMERMTRELQFSGQSFRVLGSSTIEKVPQGDDLSVKFETSKLDKACKDAISEKASLRRSLKKVSDEFQNYKLKTDKEMCRMNRYVIEEDYKHAERLTKELHYVAELHKQRASIDTLKVEVEGLKLEKAKKQAECQLCKQHPQQLLEIQTKLQESQAQHRVYLNRIEELLHFLSVLLRELSLSFKNFEAMLLNQDWTGLIEAHFELEGANKKLRLDTPDLELQRYRTAFSSIRELVLNKLKHALDQTKVPIVQRSNSQQIACDHVKTEESKIEHFEIIQKSKPSLPSTDVNLESLGSQLLRVLKLCGLAFEEGASPQEALIANISRVFESIERSYQLQGNEVEKVQKFLEVFSIDYDSISSGDWNSRTVHSGIMSKNLAGLLQEIGVIEKALEMRRNRKKQLDEANRKAKRK